MRLKVRHLTLLLGIGLAPAAVSGAWAQSSPEFEAWLKASKLGAHQTEENWDEITAAAKKEGALTVYSSATTMTAAGEDFAKAYPEIKVQVFPLGSEKTIEKVLSEHQAGIYAVDVVYSGGTQQMVYDLLPNQNIVNYVPAYLKDRIDEKYREPLLTQNIEAFAITYNGEVNTTPPIKNIWELTEPKWKGRFMMKAPIGSATTTTALAAFVEHSDDLDKAYEAYAGKKIELSEGVENAGYEFLHRILANDVVIQSNSGKIAEASGKAGQKTPPITLAPMAYLTRNDTDGYVNVPAYDLVPSGIVTYPNFVAVGGQAPHPNAAKLFIAFMMGSKDLNKDTQLKAPFREGDAGKLLQGMGPFFRIGTFSPRNDVPMPPNAEKWPVVTKWQASPEFVRDNVAKLNDFWLQRAN